MTRPEAHAVLGYLKRYRSENITCERNYTVASQMIAEVMETLKPDNSELSIVVNKHTVGDMTEPQLAAFIVKTVQESIARNALYPNF